MCWHRSALIVLVTNINNILCSVPLLNCLVEILLSGIVSANLFSDCSDKFLEVTMLV